MIIASELGGFIAGHAICSLSDGAMLIPMLAYITVDDERKMERLAHDDLRTAVEYGKRRLTSNDMDANDAALVYDARIPIGDQTSDAIVIEMRSYFSPDSEAAIGIPYTPKSAGKFDVHKPTLLEWNWCEDFTRASVFEAFFRGLADYQKQMADLE